MRTPMDSFISGYTLSTTTTTTTTTATTTTTTDMFRCQSHGVGVAHLIMMSTAMNMEQIGSANIQPHVWIKMDNTITPTLPSVSARMCRKISGGVVT